MSKKELLVVLRQATDGISSTVTDEGERVVVRMVTGYEAGLLAGCLTVMRNVDATALGGDVFIPIDETGYTVRAHEHEPEPRP